MPNERVDGVECLRVEESMHKGWSDGYSGWLEHADSRWGTHALGVDAYGRESPPIFPAILPTSTDGDRRGVVVKGQLLSQLSGRKWEETHNSLTNTSLPLSARGAGERRFDVPTRPMPIFYSSPP